MSAKILVIEDNRANLELIVYLLNAFHYETFSAMTGEDGLKMGIEKEPDLVVCDIHLPGIDGYEVIRRFKSDSILKSIPVIAVTALAMVGEREKILAAGFDGYISKPIDPEKFIKNMESFLNVKKRSKPRVLSTEDSHPSLAKVHTQGTILVVDNSSVNMDLIRSTLEPFGFKVILAEKVSEAMEFLKSERYPNLILSDLHMPQETGYDFLAAVKKDPKLCLIPFVVITSSVWGEKDRELVMQLGASEFLLRPIEPLKLLEAINDVLKKNEQQP